MGWRAAGAIDDRVGRQSKLLQLSRRGNNVLETKQCSYAPEELGAPKSSTVFNPLYNIQCILLGMKIKLNIKNLKKKPYIENECC